MLEPESRADQVPIDADEDEDDGEPGAQFTGESTTDALSRYATLSEQFAVMLRHQVQFDDHRFVATLERQGHNLFNLIKECLEFERITNSTRTPNPNTWDCRFANTMYYRTRSPGSSSD